MKIQIRKLEHYKGYELPIPSTEGSAGIDLCAAIDEAIVIETDDDAELIPTGLSIYIEDPNYAALLLPRSGLGHKHGLVLGNLVGLIDSDYQGELMISAWNRGIRNIIIEPGDRIAQMIIVPVMHYDWEEVDYFTETDSWGIQYRGEEGFGSTGT